MAPVNKRNTDSQRLKIVEWFEAFPDTVATGSILEHASGIPASVATQWLSSCLWYRDRDKPHKWRTFAEGLERVGMGQYVWRKPGTRKPQPTSSKTTFTREMKDDDGTWLLRDADTGELVIVKVQQ